MENTITTRFNELKQKATDQAFGVLKQPNRFSVETLNLPLPKGRGFSVQPEVVLPSVHERDFGAPTPSCLTIPSLKDETVNNARLFLADKSEKLKFSSRSFNDEIQNLVYFNSFINLNEQTGLFDLT